ncbi:prolyl oligopeptidase [Kwoniella heveanensis CBS 569]|nr:prolyl oligopeptidase [Kwoniella heveanensis CBS 569]
MTLDLTPRNIADSKHLPVGTLSNEPIPSAAAFIAHPQEWRSGNISLPDKYPDPPRIGGVVTEIFGEEVSDPWRILEDLESTETQRFIAEQNALSLPLLTGHALRRPLEKAVEQCYSHEQMSVPQLQADGWYYWSFNAGTSPRDILVRSKDLVRDFGRAPIAEIQTGSGEPEGPEVFFDLNDQKEISLYAHSFSPSGRLWCAILQDSGSDWQTIRVYDTQSKKAIDTDLGGSKFTFGVTWVGETGFIYKRIIDYDFVKGIPNFSDGKFGMYYHRIGEPQSSDIGVLQFTDKFDGRFVGKAKIVSVDAKADSGKRAWLSFDLYRNTNPETELLIVELPGGTGAVDGKIIQNLIYNDAKFVTTGFTGETYYIGSLSSEQHLFVSTADGHSTGRIVAFDTSDWDITPPGGTLPLKEIVPVHKEGYQLNILSATFVGDRLIVLVYLKHACASVVFADARTGRLLGSADAYGTRGDVELDPDTRIPVPKEELQLARKGKVVIPEHGQIKTLSARSDTDDFYFAVDTFVAPPYILRGQVIGNASGGVGLEVEISSINEPRTTPQETLVCSQVFYESHDGEKIPMFICHAHDLDLTRPHPTLLHGYGGYCSPILPHFDPFFATSMRNLRGIVAIAGIRGGGEYGKRWHDAAIGTKRYVAWDDFAYAATYLQAQGLTTPSMTAIYGSSNGGLLVSACMNRHPELYNTVFADVAVTDLLRYHLFSHGAMWLAEFGSPDDPTDFPVLLKTSPLHNVASNQTYPSVFITTADKDNRVIPGHGLKLLAELQDKMPLSASTQGQGQGLFLGRVYENTGHEAGSKSLAKKVEETTDRLIFALMTLKPE